jgi:ABC-type transport system involved in multi-copper enzyme maturation permease subunit
VTSAIAPVVANSVFIFVVLLATLYGGELVWRERQLKLDQVQDSMPVPVWVTFGGKLLGVFFAIALLLVISTAGGMLMQIAQGYARLQVRMYLQIVGAIALPTAFAVVALAMGVPRARQSEVRRPSHRHRVY